MHPPSDWGSISPLAGRPDRSKRLDQPALPGVGNVEVYEID